MNEIALAGVESNRPLDRPTGDLTIILSPPPTVIAYVRYFHYSNIVDIHRQSLRTYATSIIVTL